jgi:hypothetical protein
MKEAEAGNGDALWGLGRAHASLLNDDQKNKVYNLLMKEAEAGNEYAILGICENFGSINIMERGMNNLRFDDLTSETMSKVQTLWSDHALPMRGTFIREAREAYEVFFDFIPAEFKDEILRRLEGPIKTLYENEEAEIFRRLESAAKGHELNLNESDLPFKIFYLRMQKIIPILKTYLDKQAASVSVEPFQDQKNYYLNLFENLFNLAAKHDLDIAGENFNEELLKCSAYGFVLHGPQHLVMISRVNGFIDAIQEATEGLAGMSDTIGILHFLSEAIKIQPEASGQLGRILDKKPETKKVFLAQLWRAFSSIPIQTAMDYLDWPDKPHELGAARPFVVFLSNNVPELRQAERFIPEGKDSPMPVGGIAISQIMKWLQLHPPKKDNDLDDGLDELFKNLDKLPPPSEALEAEMLRNLTVQREEGADKAETVQNSSDALLGKRGELVVDWYLQKGEAGVEEYAEDAADNGPGAEDETKLIVPGSTKAEGEQIDLVGFFGTGKYVTPAGTDRIEVINRNSKRAYLYTFAFTKNDKGVPINFRLIGRRRITNLDGVPKGFRRRFIKLVENTVPELDQMLSQRAWKTFAGLAQSDDFHIYFVDAEGKKQPLTVECRVLSESDFVAVKPGEKEARNFGKMRVLSVKDMPLQIVDKRGLRVRDLKEEYMALVPASLRKHFRELGIILQIPLPLIRNRSAFEHEDEYLPTIQKYVALELYKAIVHETLTQTSPQFVFEGFPIDWETNDSYWNSINTGDRDVIAVASKINQENYRSISPDELSNLLTEPGKLDKEKKFVKLMLLLEVNVGESREKTSLFLRRLAIQRQIEESLAGAQAELLKSNGFSVGRVPEPTDLPFGMEKVSQALSIQLAHAQMRSSGERVIDPDQYSPEEKELLRMAYSIGKHFGIEAVALVGGDVSFAGAFRAYRGKHAMFLNQRLALNLGADATDTIIHELAHWLEELMRREEQTLWNEGFVAHSADFTHDAIGTFAEAMKYAAAVALANHGKSKKSQDSGDDRENGSRLTLTQSEQVALKHFLLKLLRIHKDKMTHKDLAVALSGYLNPPVFEVELAQDVPDSSSRDLRLFIKGQAEPIFSIQNAFKELETLPQKLSLLEQKEFHQEQTAQGLWALLNLAGIAAKTEGISIGINSNFSAGHQILLGRLAQIENLALFQAHVQILTEQIVRLHKKPLYKKDIFFIENSLSEFQKQILKTVIEKANASDFIQMGGIENFKGVRIFYPPAETVSELPRNPANSFILPASGIGEDSLLGWAGILETGSILARILSPDGRKIDWAGADADALKTIFNFYNSRAKKPIPSLELFKTLLKGEILNPNVLPDYGFFLPLLERVSIQNLIAGARLAARTTLAAA